MLIFHNKPELSQKMRESFIFIISINISWLLVTNVLNANGEFPLTQNTNGKQSTQLQIYEKTSHADTCSL